MRFQNIQPGVFANRPIRMMRRDFNQPGRRIARDYRGVNRRARDVLPALQTTSGNALPAPSPLSQFGWIGQAIGDMGNTQRWADSDNTDNEIIAGGSYPLETLATSPAALLNASLIACAGQAQKNFGAITGLTTTATVATNSITLYSATVPTTVFGVRIRISNSLTNFKFATYELQLWNGVPTALSSLTGAASYIYITVASLPVDIIMLNIANAAGKATIIGNSAPVVLVPYSTTAGSAGYVNAGSVAITDVFYAETLNMRDIGNIAGAISAGQISL
jgi:hypothetical protein